MPGTPPPVATEREALSVFLRQQHDGIRNAAFGLTDEQAHAAPSRSAITVAGLVKHLTHMERTWLERARAGAGGLVADARSTQDRAAEYGADWDATDQTLAEVLAAFDLQAADTEAAALDESLDLDAPVPVPRDAPWFPKDVDAWSVRWVLFHILEETARHAGHADIVREHLDGATMYELLAAAEGWPETPWLKPWRPAEPPSAG
ncbi:MAG: DinB family protein [Lapillicoccus sp.]